MLCDKKITDDVLEMVTKEMKDFIKYYEKNRKTYMERTIMFDG